MDRPNALILDTETTGLDGDAEVVELAVIDCAGSVPLDIGVLSRNRRNFRHPSSSPATSSSRSIILPSLWKV
jgi:hypothetical protein